MKCAACGKAITKSLFSNKPLCSHRCFNVDFWNKFVSAAQAGDVTDDGCLVVRADGSHYVINPDQASGMRGHGGREFRVYFTAGPHAGKTAVTHNLWTQGAIPAFCRDKLPDNAEFLPVEVAALFP